MATKAKAIDRAKLLDWYHQIVLIREFENRCDELYHAKKITGVYMHLYSGHEAIGVGALAALGANDHVITAYRDHGIALARGVDPKRAMAEMMGRRDGVSGGKGGSMHMAQRDLNFWGGYAIVGGHLPLATGIALKERYTGTENVVISFVGDGATNNGYFHEAVNMAGVWDLPVIWIIENNLIGMGTRIEDAAGQPELVKRAIAYGIKEGPRIEGQDVVTVYDAVSEAVAYARKKGSVLIEALTYRFKGHGVSDKQFDARDEFKAELEEWASKDPINILRGRLLGEFDDIESELDRIDAEAVKTIDEAVEFAEKSPAPTYEDLIKHVYVEA